MLDVIIVCFNSDACLLQKAMKSVQTAASGVDVPVRVLLFDNGSSQLPEGLPGVDVVRCEENLGFGRAVNAALSKCEGSYVLLLNPDAELDEAALLELLQVARKYDQALFSGWLCKHGAPQVDAFMHWIFSAGRRVRRPRYQRYLASMTGAEVLAVEKVCGGALFARRELLNDLGPFDDRFFLYGEDADLSLRASAQGISLFAVPKAVVEHVGAASQRKYSELVERARADAAIRVTAYHANRWVSYLQRLELGVVTIIGALAGGRSSVSRSSRLSRLTELSRWGFRMDRPRFDPKCHF